MGDLGAGAPAAGLIGPSWAAPRAPAASWRKRRRPSSTLFAFELVTAPNGRSHASLPSEAAVVPRPQNATPCHVLDRRRGADKRPEPSFPAPDKSPRGRR